MRSTCIDGPVKRPFCSLREHFGAFASQAAKFEELVASSSNMLQILRRWLANALSQNAQCRSQNTFYEFAIYLHIQIE
jgi:hypothetical protein